MFPNAQELSEIAEPISKSVLEIGASADGLGEIGHHLVGRGVRQREDAGRLALEPVDLDEDHFVGVGTVESGDLLAIESDEFPAEVVAFGQEPQHLEGPLQAELFENRLHDGPGGGRGRGQGEAPHDQPRETIKYARFNEAWIMQGDR